MKNKIRIFIKTHRAGQEHVSFSCITLNSVDGSSSLSLSGLVSSANRHRATLKIINSYLKNIDQNCKKNAYELVFYADNDEIAHEWMNEYKKEGCFSENTADQDLYDRIIKQAKKFGLTITIIGKDSVLSSISRVLK